MQNLATYTQPPNFRGRSAFVCQLWWLVQSLLLNTSPQFLFGWRVFLLRLFGAKIGRDVKIRPSVKVTYPWKLEVGDFSWIGDNVVLYSLGPIRIGKSSVISQRSYICTGSHDAHRSSFDIFSLPVVIGDGVWLATDVFVAPGVCIANGVVVGARSSVFKSIGREGIYAGTPATFIKPRSFHQQG
ncbi:WcaF family extracellular polysaccharide biosynthesis acetyltransferase [Halopseudomonas nanhaiensis]|uniref:WcaF family extracellular polysaccharide biosynthesis acetyltransferase n=1 Tax=Halopseudomonas nanhaiensis TaxID=2830842 RepID=UPI00226B2841|nr:WcaF family extracellular polysaccharide biosynthesis acetyltransferase [Halopseudomonas nanhaiensis]UAW99447.1 WcaF family extracellular polysaccharide biosynthesis acetyltransferase [Halopseudomonas nanhaiensis]